jgi:LysM repeat protein
MRLLEMKGLFNVDGEASSAQTTYMKPLIVEPSRFHKRTGGSYNKGGASSPIMKRRHPLILASVAASALLMAGCATDREAQTRSIRSDVTLLSATNALPGSTYDIRVYVIAKGDTAARIARKFGISIANLRAINPDLDTARLKIGQKIRVYEMRTQ